MALNQNKHVDRLHRYLPFSPTHDQIYEEFQTSEDSLNLDTKAFKFLIDAIPSGANLIILTGDAGHGKTHLCRRLLEHHFNFSQNKAREIINKECDGNNLIKGDDPKSKPLRIFKDFSEMNNDEASVHIESAINNVNETTIICANEGKLRVALELNSHKEGSSQLLERFNNSFVDGLATQDDKTHIINLNYQSVAVKKDGLITMAVKSWVSGTRWKICKTCDSSSVCPIFFNRNQFSSETNSADIRLEKLNTLIATVERLGVVVTFREMLMALAYLLTSGLKCNDVHKKSSNKKIGWQHSYIFYNALFDTPSNLSSDKLHKISMLKILAQLDPGLISNGKVDNLLLNEQGVFEAELLDLSFTYRGGPQRVQIDAAQGFDDLTISPANNKERQQESAFVSKVVKALRRKYFFENESNKALTYLGFEYGNEFEQVLGAEVTATQKIGIKNRIVAGLHTIQGLQMNSNETNLHVVDPSFNTSVNNAAIIAKRIPVRAIDLISMKNAWNAPDEITDKTIYNSVDWIDRHIVLRVKIGNSSPIDFPMNLMVFDCIARASTGYVAEEFYAHDLRRIKTFLSSLVRNQYASDGDISLFIKGRMHSVSIDNGVISVGGGH